MNALDAKFMDDDIDVILTRLFGDKISNIIGVDLNLQNQ
jgi:hypothetical protein